MNSADQSSELACWQGQGGHNPRVLWSRFDGTPVELDCRRACRLRLDQWQERENDPRWKGAIKEQEIEFEPGRMISRAVNRVIQVDRLLPWPLRARWKRGRPILVAASRTQNYRLLQPYLAEAGFLPLALLRDDQSEEDWPDRIVDPANERELPVLSFSEYARKRNSRRHRKVPLVVADAGDGVDFRKLAPRVAALLGEGQRLLHPAFLVDYLSHDLSRNVIAYGFPGSGNVIVQKIVATLLAPYRAGRFDQLESWCASGHIALCDILREALSRAGFEDVAIGYGQPGYLTVVAATSAHGLPRLYLPEVPSKICWAESVYGTHSPPVRQHVARLVSMGGRLVLIVRHPLDTIVSMAAKHAARFAGQIQLERGCSMAEAREVATRQVLDMDEILHPIIHELKAFITAAADLGPGMTVLRYEDLMADPAAFIQHVAEVLEVALPLEMRSELEGLVGRANLGPPMHLNKPGAGKWKSLLTEKHLARIGGSGLLMCAKWLGYDQPEMGNSRDGGWQATAQAISAFSHMYYLCDKRVRRLVKRHHVIGESHGLEVTSETEEPIKAFRSMLQDDVVLRRIVGSMSLR